MDDHYYRTDYYYRKQFRFRKKRSILTCLANIHNVIQKTKAAEQKLVMCVLDFSKAFDCLDIPIMLESLHQSGIRGKALEWIDSWCRGGAAQLEDVHCEDGRHRENKNRVPTVLGVKPRYTHIPSNTNHTIPCKMMLILC